MSDLLLISLGLLTVWTFWSGFTDAANSISTVVATKVLTPIKAVGLAAVGNLMGIFMGQAVATTIGKGIVSPEIISGTLVIAAIIGGLMWDTITYIRGLPISESQVLVGGLMGAGIAAGGLEKVQLLSTVQRVFIPMAVAPIVAFVVGFLVVVIVIRVFFDASRLRVNKIFGRLQILSSLFFSISHGANDAQKTAGVIAGLLVYYGVQTEFSVPLWALILSFGMLSLGTLFGGWRIVRTMGFRVTHLMPFQGFCAETGAAVVVGVASQVGFPLSTTQTVSGSIMGVGASRRATAVRGRVAREIVVAWLLTIPMSAIFSYGVYRMLSIFL